MGDRSENVQPKNKKAPGINQRKSGLSKIGVFGIISIITYILN
jgi:hypothetical protein